MSNKQWDAIILNDYEAVLPLVWKRKWIYKIIYQPFFCQQLGVFSIRPAEYVPTEKMVQSIPSGFRYIHMHLNPDSSVLLPGIKFLNRTSFFIRLNKPYYKIYDNYKTDAKKNLAQLSEQDYSYFKSDSPQLAADCFFAAYGKYYKDAEVIKQMITACAVEATQMDMGFTRSIYGPDGELWCSGFFFSSNKTIHYSMAAPTEAGRKAGATHALLDEVLKEFSESELTFDFEGSDIKNVAYFYSKFGPEKYHYYSIEIDKLPAYIQLLRKQT